MARQPITEAVVEVRMLRVFALPRRNRRQRLIERAGVQRPYVVTKMIELGD